MDETMAKSPMKIGELQLRVNSLIDTLKQFDRIDQRMENILSRLRGKQPQPETEDKQEPNQSTVLYGLNFLRGDYARLADSMNVKISELEELI